MLIHEEETVHKDLQHADKLGSTMLKIRWQNTEKWSSLWEYRLSENHLQLKCLYSVKCRKHTVHNLDCSKGSHCLLFNICKISWNYMAEEHQGTKIKHWTLLTPLICTWPTGISQLCDIQNLHGACAELTDGISDAHRWNGCLEQTKVQTGNNAVDSQDEDCMFTPDSMHLRHRTDGEF